MNLIERQAAIDAMKDTFKGTMVGTRVAVDAINRLPSAELRCIATIHLSQEQLDEAFEKVKADILSVKPKIGKWISKGMSINCSVCHKCSWSLCFEDTVRKFNYCPNCGAKMEVEDETECPCEGCTHFITVEDAREIVVSAVNKRDANHNCDRKGR